jgi:hypothetical protein
LLVPIGILALCSSLAAQEFRGSIGGTVTDATGAVVPGVKVTIQNTGTGVAQNVISDARGQYQVRYLNSGTYASVTRSWSTSASSPEASTRSSRSMRRPLSWTRPPG